MLLLLMVLVLLIVFQNYNYHIDSSGSGTTICHLDLLDDSCCVFLSKEEQKKRDC